MWEDVLNRDKHSTSQHKQKHISIVKMNSTLKNAIYIFISFSLCSDCCCCCCRSQVFYFSFRVILFLPFFGIVYAAADKLETFQVPLARRRINRIRTMSLPTVRMTRARTRALTLALEIYIYSHQIRVNGECNEHEHNHTEKQNNNKKKLRRKNKCVVFELPRKREWCNLCV